MSGKISGVYCFKSFQARNPLHIALFEYIGFKFLRFFLNLADLPFWPDLAINSPSARWREYIINFIDTAKEGTWCWDNFSKNWWSAEPGSPYYDTLKDNFIFCEDHDIIPIICAGHTEEQTSWITRAPNEATRSWLGRFAQELSYYIYEVYKYKAAKMEVWNEINECLAFGFGFDQYADLSKKMLKGFTQFENYTGQVGGCDIQNQSLYKYITQDAELMKLTREVTTHILTHDEWDYREKGTGKSYIDLINDMIAPYPWITQGLTEMSPLGKWNRLNDLLIWSEPNASGNREVIGQKVSQVGPVLAFRNKIIGTAFDIDDLMDYDFDIPGEDNIIVHVDGKIEALRNFYINNNTDIKPKERGEMILSTLYDKQYETINGKTSGPYTTAGYLAEWAQLTLKAAVNPAGIPFYNGEISGKYDGQTKAAVIKFQQHLIAKEIPNIAADGKVGRKMYGYIIEELISQDEAQGLLYNRMLDKLASPTR